MSSAQTAPPGAPSTNHEPDTSTPKPNASSEPVKSAGLDGTEARLGLLFLYLPFFLFYLGGVVFLALGVCPRQRGPCCRRGGGGKYLGLHWRYFGRGVPRDWESPPTAVIFLRCLYLDFFSLYFIWCWRWCWGCWELRVCCVLGCFVAEQ